MSTKRKAANPLKKITAEAKRIRKKSPGKSWRTAVKEAGVKYRKAHKPAKKKAVKKKAAKRRTVRKVATKHIIKRRVAGGVPARLLAPGTVASHVGAAKKLLEASLGRLETRKFLAKKTSERRKIQKSINHTKVQLRKLMNR